MLTIKDEIVEGGRMYCIYDCECENKDVKGCINTKFITEDLSGKAFPQSKSYKSNRQQESILIIIEVE